MQQLGVVPSLFEALLRGEKHQTIRWRERVIEPGLMTYICDGDQALSCVVRVTKCTHMPLRSVAGYLGREEEWPDDVMLQGMKRHYPEISLDEIVQVVEHLSPKETQEEQPLEA